MRMNRKFGIVLACILCTLLLTGSIFREAKIVTYNGEPLIDLDSLIHSTETGQEGSSDDGAYVTPIPNPGPGDDDPTDPKPPVTEPDDREGKYVIEIYNTDIRCGGTVFAYDREKNGLKDKENTAMDAIFKDIADKEIVIVDDYAEAHALAYTVNYLKERFSDSVSITFDPDFGKEWGVSR